MRLECESLSQDIDGLNILFLINVKRTLVVEPPKLARLQKMSTLIALDGISRPMVKVQQHTQLSHGLGIFWVLKRGFVGLLNLGSRFWWKSISLNVREGWQRAPGFNERK